MYYTFCLPETRLNFIEILVVAQDGQRTTQVLTPALLEITCFSFS